MKFRSALVGQRAERRAVRFLRALGYRIIERNVRLGRNEIDIVALDKRCVVCVEVRYRDAGLEAAFRSVNNHKKAACFRAISAYRTRERLWDVEIRGDLIAVSKEGSRWRIEHQVGELTPP